MQLCKNLYFLFILMNSMGGYMAKEKKDPIKKYYEKDRNRFMSLRYASDTAEYPTLTATELANEIGYSKGTISKLENPTIEEYEILSTQAGLLKAYHDKFGCSYEYLYGESNLPDPKYASLDASSPLSQLDGNSLTNLEQLLSSNEFKEFNSYMLKAFLANPLELQELMNKLFRFMYVLNQIYSNETLNQAEKELQASQYWYSLNTNLDVYLRDSLLPCLQVGFKKYETKQTEREKEEIERVEKDYEQYLKETSSPAIVTNVKIIEKEDGQ